MSQSATLYRVSTEIFRQLETSDKEKDFKISTAKDYATFQSSFMGLEYILSKGQNESTTQLVNEIFNPGKALGEQDFEKLTLEDKFEFYESSNLIPYLDAPAISKLNHFLDKVSEADIRLKYDPKELNDNGIYPEVWHNDNSSDLAFSGLHILEDFSKLKAIIKLADKENDYILVFIG